MPHAHDRTHQPHSRRRHRAQRGDRKPRIAPSHARLRMMATRVRSCERTKGWRPSQRPTVYSSSSVRSASACAGGVAPQSRSTPALRASSAWNCAEGCAVAPSSACALDTAVGDSRSASREASASRRCSALPCCSCSQAASNCWSSSAGAAIFRESGCDGQFYPAGPVTDR
jgi:hypothetical protein